LSYFATNLISFDSNLLQLICNAAISIVITVIIICVVLHRTSGFQYFLHHTPVIRRLAGNEKQ
jgi:hypothetical protein